MDKEVKKHGHFYHQYVDRLLVFLVPKDKVIGTLDRSFRGLETGQKYDYIVLSDVLGYTQDIEEFLRSARDTLVVDGRVVITQYNSLWEPILRFASVLRLRAQSVEQNWLSPHDLRNFLYLAGFETIREGNKMLLPIYVPLLSSLCNKVLANIWPFSKLGLIHYVVARPLPNARTDNPSLSIIVPARNEAGTIERIVKELPSLGPLTEIIFIEGHSKDNTLAEIERVTKEYTGDKRIRYAVQDGNGKGDAVRKGFDMATGDILAIYDADMTVPPEDMEKFYRAMVRHQGDFINGSRLVYPVEKGAMRILNFFGNKFFSLAFTAILGQQLKDTLCGTKVLWKKDYKSIQENRAFFGDFDPFGDFDLLFGAAKLNLKIIEVPVRYKERVYGETNISRWKHGWLLLKMTIFAARKLKFW
ncbi:MAG TPA: glycosyltransferase [Candidatus Paceibacterota bacterium]